MHNHDNTSIAAIFGELYGIIIQVEARLALC